MTKSKAQKLRAKLGLKGPAQRNAVSAEIGILKARALGSPGTGKAARKRRNRKRKNALGGPPGVNLGRGTRRIPAGVSMVSDGVNVGSVWKNTTAERVTFPLAREKFKDLVSTASVFEIVSQLYVNPGNTSLFPIFAEIAKCYEEYIPNVLRIYFRTEEYMASGSVVSAGLGAMAVDFDANDSNFTSMTQLENYEHAISGAPFSGIMCLDVLEEINKRKRNGQRGARGKDLSQNNYFVYYSANSIGPTTDQAKFYDIGNFQFALANAQASTGVGELWIEYSFTMIRRKSPEATIAPTSLVSHFVSRADDATAAAPLGLTSFTNVGVQTGSFYGAANMNSGAGITAYGTGLYAGFNDAIDTRFNLPNVTGVWSVSCVWSGATAIAAIPAITLAGGAAVLNIWGPAGLSAPYGFFLAAGTSAAITFTATSTYTAVPVSGTNIVTISGLTGMTDGNWDIYMSRLPNALVTVDEVASIRTPDFVRAGVPIPLSKEDRVEKLERMVRELTFRNLDDWNCRSIDNRKPEIPMRASESDSKSQTSSILGKSRFFK